MASGSPRRSERKIGKGACDGSISLPSARGTDGSTAGSRSTSSICTAPIPKKRRIAVRAGDTARPATRTIATTSARTAGRRAHDSAGRVVRSLVWAAPARSGVGGTMIALLSSRSSRSRSRIGRKLLPHAFEAAREPRLHRSLAHSEHVGRLRLSEIKEEAAYDGEALLLGQASDGVEERAPTLAFEDRRLGGRGRVPRATLFSRAKREAFVAA